MRKCDCKMVEIRLGPLFTTKVSSKGADQTESTTTRAVSVPADSTISISSSTELGRNFDVWIDDAKGSLADRTGGQVRGLATTLRSRSRRRDFETTGRTC